MTKLTASEQFKHCDVTIDDVTTDFGVLNVQGRYARKILEQACPQTKWDNDSFPAYTQQEVALADGTKLQALRVTFMGELGWELHYANADAGSVRDAVFGASERLVAEGTQGAELRWCGYNAVDSLSVEKGFKHWHEDIQVGSEEMIPVSCRRIGCGTVVNRLIPRPSNPKNSVCQSPSPGPRYPARGRHGVHL